MRLQIRIRGSKLPTTLALLGFSGVMAALAWWSFSPRSHLDLRHSSFRASPPSEDLARPLRNPSSIGGPADSYKAAEELELRVSALLEQMTAEEKIQIIAGDYFDTHPIPRLGIPSIKMTDGPLGARWSQATAFPAPVLLGASFDPDLVREVAAAMGAETRARGRNLLLAPCVGIARHPLGGRNFESYGEDPYLNSRMAVSMIQGLRSQRVMAAVKHFALNDQETQRTTIDTYADDRALHEIHFPMFKAAVDAGVWAVMSSYNKVRGDWASESKWLLTGVLKELWGFRGFVVSDWDSTHDPLKAALAGLDLEMPRPTVFNKQLMTHVKAGRLPMELIDDKVKRILRAIVGSGLMDENAPSSLPQIDSVDVARRAAASGFVLLKNDDGLLPIQSQKLRSVALIGPGVRHVRIGAGGSSAVVPTKALSFENGFKNALASLQPGGIATIQVRSADGAPLKGDFRGLPAADLKDGAFRAEYFSNTNLLGAPAKARLEPLLAFDWIWTPPDAALAYDAWSARYRGRWIAPHDGKHDFVVRASDGIRVWVDGRLVVNNWKAKPETIYRFSRQARRGESAELVLEERTFAHPKTIAIGYARDNPDATGNDPSVLQTEALSLARDSDAAVLVMGFSSRHEGESVDRKSLDLPEEQNELIQRVLEVQPNTIVIINSGNPVSMPWADRAKAILMAWYPGQEGAEALADVVLGKLNPSGKLPVTFPKKWEDSPAYGAFPEDSPGSGRLTYREGVYVGYRGFDSRGIDPLFPFGHGLSYTKFQYSSLDLQLLQDGLEAVVSVSFNLQNIGERTGAEAAQVYISPRTPVVDRPVQELKGIMKVALTAGQSRRVQVPLDRMDFARWDQQSGDWVVDPGVYEVRVGSSSRDIKLIGTVEL